MVNRSDVIQSITYDRESMVAVVKFVTGTTMTLTHVYVEWTDTGLFKFAVIPDKYLDVMEEGGDAVQE